MTANRESYRCIRQVLHGQTRKTCLCVGLAEDAAFRLVQKTVLLATDCEIYTKKRIAVQKTTATYKGVRGKDCICAGMFPCSI